MMHGGRLRNRPPTLVDENDEKRGWLPHEQVEFSRVHSIVDNDPKTQALMERRKEQLKRLRAKYGDHFGERLGRDKLDHLGLRRGSPFSSIIKDSKNVAARSPRLVQKYERLTDYQPLPITQPKVDPELKAFMRNYHEDCAEKEHMLRQLKAANITLTQTICQRLPTWKEVTELYGSGPVVLGLETCSDYRNRLQKNSNYSPQAAVAGLWNSGTTALSLSLLRNLVGFNSSTDISEPTVPWGKHTPLYLKYHNTWPKEKRSLRDREMKDHVLPVLIVRDPFRWMKTMASPPTTVSSRIMDHGLFSHIFSLQHCEFLSSSHSVYTQVPQAI